MSTEHQIRSDIELATLFHNTYERLAPSFGYETRPDTKLLELDSPNGQLMIAVAHEVNKKLEALITKREQSMVESTINSIAYYSAMSRRKTVKVDDLLNPESSVVKYAKQVSQLKEGLDTNHE